MAQAGAQRTLEPTLSGFFGGDWLRFLEYLGETPHPAEEIVTAIPESELFTSGTAGKTPKAAVGVQATAEASLVEERVAVLKAYWRQFDDLHSRQAPGMPSLWGLVEEDHTGVRIRWEGPDWFTPKLYQHVLSPELSAKIDEKWSTVMLARWP